MSDDFHTLEAEGIRVTIDLRVGHVRELAIEHAGRTLRPLHTAPWVDDPSITQDESLPGNLRHLSGDFFCAPFGPSDLEGGPLHGWPANSSWRLIEVKRENGGATGRYELERRVMGARLVKEFRLCDGHPFLYERHILHGGSGAISVANHAMIRFTGPGLLSFSKKQFAETPPIAPEPDPTRGRSRLAYPARFDDLSRAPCADGGAADLTRYPIADRHEDFVMLVEAKGHALGWAAAVRPDRGELFLSLKNPADYPVTFLWFSNGGRDYRPWNGRHVGVLGIEEGRSFSAAGHKASIEGNELSRAGIPTALVLAEKGSVEVRNVIGGLAPPGGSSAIADVRVSAGALELEERAGSRLSIPFDDRFLQRQ